MPREFAGLKDHVYEGRDLEAMGFARNYHIWIRDELTPFLSGDVAEVGAGDGEFSKLILEASPRSLTLYEPSSEMFARQERNVGRDPRVRRVNAFFSSEAERNTAAFDCVVYINVLEHIEDDDAELRLIRQSLRPGGRVCVFVPAVPWLMSDFDRRIGHFRRYVRATLGAQLTAAGFGIERLHYFDGLGVLPWLLFMRMGRGDLSPRSVSLYDRVAVPLVRRIESKVRPFIGKNLFAVGRI